MIENTCLNKPLNYDCNYLFSNVLTLTTKYTHLVMDASQKKKERNEKKNSSNASNGSTWIEWTWKGIDKVFGLGTMH